MDLEKAIQNVQTIIELYKGTKAEHIALEQSMKTIIDSLKKEEPKKGK